MNFDFNANEILIMAAKIEENGAKFYREAAENVSGEEKDFLLELAKMEDDHEKTFNALSAKLTNAEKEGQSFDPDNEAVEYCKALADMRVFFEKKSDFSSMKEIVKEAILAEKDSIVFYLGMEELVTAGLGKDKEDNLIKEEMSHIRLLTKTLKTL